jgi:hypothetical protein
MLRKRFFMSGNHLPPPALGKQMSQTAAIRPTLSAAALNAN